MPSSTPARSIPRRPSHPSPLQTCSSQACKSATKRPSRTGRRILAVTSLGLAGLLAGLLSGCATGILPSPSATANSYTALSGNWQFSSSAAAAARLSSLGGSLSASNLASGGATITGILHPLNVANQCLGANSSLAVTGSIDAASHLTLTAPVSGGTLTLSGTVAPDRKSLSAPTYTISGGACASPADAAVTAQTVGPRDGASPVTAQQYQPVSGTYSGTLTTGEGQTFPLTSTLSQTSQPDANGVYHVQGTASSPGNTCVPTSLSATASTIDGGSISTTYTDSVTGTSITGTGATSPDAATITISNWTINSPCGQDTGTGTLTRQ